LKELLIVASLLWVFRSRVQESVQSFFHQILPEFLFVIVPTKLPNDLALHLSEAWMGRWRRVGTGSISWVGTRDGGAGGQRLSEIGLDFFFMSGKEGCLRLHSSMARAVTIVVGRTMGSITTIPEMRTKTTGSLRLTSLSRLENTPGCAMKNSGLGVGKGHNKEMKLETKDDEIESKRMNQMN
jgi:hypothetical protein